MDLREEDLPTRFQRILNVAEQTLRSGAWTNAAQIGLAPGMECVGDRGL
jgi:hypothetical protein